MGLDRSRGNMATLQYTYGTGTSDTTISTGYVSATCNSATCTIGDAVFFDESAKQYKKKYDRYIDELRNNVDGYLKGVLDI
jgi:hypothetical protein